MNPLNPQEPGSHPEPESPPPPSAKDLLGASTRPVYTPSFSRPTIQFVPEVKPPFWESAFFKFFVVALIAGAVGGWAYYHYYFIKRLPQERNLTDLQGQHTQATILGHDDTLLQYTLPGSDTVRYLSLATLSATDQQFVANLNPTPLAKLPFVCTLTDSTGKETAVRLLAHNDDWAQFTLIADGSTRYIYLPTLTPSDQAVVRLLPAGLDFRFPMNYSFTGAPKPGDNIQLLGRNDITVEYLELSTGQKYFMAIAQLSPTDQSFVREFPPSLADQPTQTQENQAGEQAASQSDTKPNDNYEGSNYPSLDNNVLKALVSIKGDNGMGSGFIAKLHDQYFVVTNQHVLSGNKELTITNMDGDDLPANGPLYGAVDSDVAILKIPDNLAKSYLEVVVDAQTSVKTGDQVTIAGDSLGAGVPIQINGQVVAIGPQLIEINAQLTHGTSGSPIIDRRLNKVVGIATMSVTYKPDADISTGVSTDTRWIGYRVDNIDADKGWVKMDWARFRDEGVKIRDATDLYLSLDSILKDKTKIKITSDLVQTVITDFQSQVSTAMAGNNQHDVQLAYQSLNSKLRSLADSGTYDLSNASLYPYHAQRFKELNELRTYMDQAFENESRVYKNLVKAGQ